MRKCRSCGYLLLGEGDSCTRCGAPLPALTSGVPVTAGATSAAAPAAAPASWGGPSAPALPRSSFGRLSIPPPVGPTAPASGPEGPPSALPALREAWQPVTMPAPVGRPGPTRLGLVALAVSVALLSGAGVSRLLHSDPLPSGTSAFVNGGGVTYTSADGAFLVQLPQSPTIDQRTITVDSVSATIYTAIASGHDYEIGAASIALPISISPDRVNAVLESALAEGIHGSNGKLVHKNVTMRGSQPAIEGRFNAPDGYKAHLLVVSSGSTLIMLIVHAKTGTDRLYKALETSLLVR